MSKYAKLDALILAAIGDEPKMFGMILDGKIEAECTLLSEARWNAMRAYQPPGRFLDGRLQALRKAGKIRSSTKGWMRITTEDGK